MLKNLFSHFIKRKDEREVPPIPAWEEIVDLLYDKGLDGHVSEVVSVIYSIDKSMRYIILKNEKGFYTYVLEKLYPFDEDEWQYIGREAGALPGAWYDYLGNRGKSVFGTFEQAVADIRSLPEYKGYFE